jgi:hypothetical protein
VGDRIRTGDNQIHSAAPAHSQIAATPCCDNSSAESLLSPAEMVAQMVARIAQGDPDLARLLAAWPTLSVIVKRTILLLLQGEGG